MVVTLILFLRNFVTHGLVLLGAGRQVPDPAGGEPRHRQEAGLDRNPEPRAEQTLPQRHLRSRRLSNVSSVSNATTQTTSGHCDRSKKSGRVKVR